ncbi:hypothetical protein FUAX_39130 (plasmid) [Fulvitalea axinellae]|uniref:Uncharacterized protein n=1 Tax=Fulvitalea axinellae TaxID=1182444 RepID=A0AAU9CH35_9BACT|nr:hypothetical protein FUAX_39130 [Fulvitalea axinellae]
MFSERRHKPSKIRSRQPAPKGVIQRAVGFELEVGNWHTYEHIGDRRFFWPWEHPKLPHEDFILFDRKSKLMEGDGFSVEADDQRPRLPVSDIEIITEPFEESEQGFRRLREVSANVGAFYEECKSKTSRLEYDRLVKLDKIKTARSLSPKYFFHSVGPPEIKAQGTMGLKVEALEQLMLDLGENPAGREPQEVSKRKHEGREWLFPSQAPENARNILTAMSPGMTRQACFRYGREEWAPDGKEWQASPEMLGFLSLVINYIEMTRAPLASYARAAFFLLARTDFATMFGMLPPMERKHFSSDNGDHFIELMEKVPWIEFTRFASPLFENGIYHDFPERNPDALKALSREQWLRGISQGVDHFTVERFPDQRNAWRLESLGAMGKKTDTDGDGTPKPIFELRSVKSQSDFRETETFMRRFFLYVCAMNRKADLKYGEIEKWDDLKV